MSEKITTRIGKFSLDPDRPPALTKKARERLALMPDDDIDFSDIPPTHGVHWTRPGILASAENKQQITLRIDADVLNFFKSSGKRYQTRMNNVLRSYMNAHAAQRSPRESQQPATNARQRASKKRG